MSLKVSELMFLFNMAVSLRVGFMSMVSTRYVTMYMLVYEVIGPSVCIKTVIAPICKGMKFYLA